MSKQSAIDYWQDQKDNADSFAGYLGAHLMGLNAEVSYRPTISGRDRLGPGEAQSGSRQCVRRRSGCHHRPDGDSDIDQGCGGGIFRTSGGGAGNVASGAGRLAKGVLEKAPNKIESFSTNATFDGNYIQIIKLIS
jgi:hypothetical protein